MAVASPSSAQVRVLISGGFSAAYQELLPQFEKSTGITVTTTRGASQGGPGPISIETELRGGLPADVVIMSREGLAELLAEGRIVIGSDVDLASAPLGVGVRVGTARPDISTVDAFKQTLLRAKSIGIQSTSGMYLKTKVFPQLGIADALAGKLSGAGAAEVENMQLRLSAASSVCLRHPWQLICHSACGCADLKYIAQPVRVVGRVQGSVWQLAKTGSDRGVGPDGSSRSNLRKRKR